MEFLLSISPSVVYAVLGIIGVVLAAASYYGLRHEITGYLRLVFAIPIIISVSSGKLLISIAEDVALNNEITKQVYEEKLFKIVINEEPKAKTLVDLTIRMVDKDNKDEAAYKAKQTALVVLRPIIESYILTASNESVYKLMGYSYQNVSMLKNSHKKCVDYYFTREPVLESIDLPYNYFKAELDALAEVVESSINNSSPIQQYDYDHIMQVVKNQYKTLGYDPKQIEKLSNFKKAKPEEACEAAITFSYVIYSMGNQAGPYVYKGLTYFNSIKEY